MILVKKVKFFLPKKGLDIFFHNAVDGRKGLVAYKNVVCIFPKWLTHNFGKKVEISTDKLFLQKKCWICSLMVF